MDDDPEPVVVEVDRVHVVPGGGTHELSPVATVVETEEVTCTVNILGVLQALTLSRPRVVTTTPTGVIKKILICPSVMIIESRPQPIYIL